jgi:hypothetical protein
MVVMEELVPMCHGEIDGGGAEHIGGASLLG